MTKKALIVVDLQKDFLEGGALEVAGAGLQYANEVLKFAEKFEGLVVATQDWHPKDHGSFASVAGTPLFSQFDLNGLPQVAWPDHCVQDTAGADLLASDSTRAIFRKGMDRAVDSYSGFADNNGLNPTGLEGFLRFHNVNEVVVVGLAFDYCVKFTALDAQKLGFKTSVVATLCRSVNPVTEESAAKELLSAGVELR